MNRTNNRVFCWLTAFICLLLNVRTNAEPLHSRGPVVIISMDGLPAFCLNDPKADLPTLHQLAKEGAVAERMEASLPTMTWPNHTTLITGVTPAKHGVIGNRYWDRDAQKNIQLIPDPIYNKDEIVKAPTLYDVAHEAGLKTAAICWPASRGAKTLDWTFPDVQKNELFQKYASPSFLAECKAAGIPVDQQEKWCRQPDGGELRDKMYTQMVINALTNHHPNLVLLHLVEIDHAEHAHGPRSAEAYKAMHFDDACVNEILQTLKTHFGGKATLIVVSDHGFATVRQQILPNVKLRQAGLFKTGAKGNDRRVFSADQGGSTYIYITDKEHRGELIDKAADAFKGVEGIDEIIKPTEFHKHGLPTADEDPHMPDLILTAKNGYTFSDDANGDTVVTSKSAQTKGAHGHSPTLPDLYATFVAWGSGIKPGAKIREIKNVDVAPTAAALLGISMPNADGRVLREILTVDR
ncbi:MAG: alkaline phosphatase family protein [Limisphaerales bacterium]